ncbi:tail protein [Bacillus licheniformis CG-B52]|nr:tail protein [Bacillus licheniformis CG-B52]
MTFGENNTTVIHAWSRAEDGRREAKEILSLALQALTKEPLEVEGFKPLQLSFLQSQVITDIDGITQHGILRIRIYINN